MAVLIAGRLAWHLGYVLWQRTSRQSFTYPSYEKVGRKTEYRKAYVASYKSEIAAYVEELLLGPSVNRSRPLFSPEVRLDFCYLSGKTLYINIAGDVIACKHNAVPVMMGIKYLYSNIKRNFRGRIKDIVLFIDGNEVYVNQQ